MVHEEFQAVLIHAPHGLGAVADLGAAALWGTPSRLSAAFLSRNRVVRGTAMRSVRLGGALVAALLLFQAEGAYAHGSSGGMQLPPDPAPVTPDGSKAKAILDALPKDEASAVILQEAAKKARLALGRADGAHLAKDGEGARILSRVALAWAEAASLAVRAAEAEKKATAEETAKRELKEKIERARALLAETEARKLQLTAETQKAELDAKRALETPKPSKDDKTKKPKKAAGSDAPAKPAPPKAKAEKKP